MTWSAIAVAKARSSDRQPQKPGTLRVIFQLAGVLAMVAFSADDLPKSIDTLEKLLVWNTTILQHLHPTLTAIESVGSAERTCFAGMLFITAGSSPEWRYFARNSVALDPNWQQGERKIWMFAKDLSSASIPAAFKR